MKVEIYSKERAKELINSHFPKNTAVISFYFERKMKSAGFERLDYTGVCERVFYVDIPDIDIEILSDYGYTLESYLSCAKELARFIYSAKKQGLDIICQCDYGQSRSAACAAAILEHFEGRGIEIFANYKYYPNQLVFNKIFDALAEYKRDTLKISS